MKKTFKVKFTAQFETTIELVDGQSLTDAVVDLNIPEDDETKYVEHTFEVDSVKNSVGVEVDPDEYDEIHRHA